MSRYIYARRPAAMVASLLVGLLVTACAAAGSTGAGAAPKGTIVAAGTQVRIVTRDNLFEPRIVTVKAGQPVTVVFVNEGQNVHEVEIKGLVNETKVQPGETKQFTITLEQKRYKLYCEIHEDTGMEGEFIGE